MSFSVIFTSFFLFFFAWINRRIFSMEATPDGFILPSGQGADRDLWWRPVTELREATGGSDTVDTSFPLDQLGVSELRMSLSWTSLKIRPISYTPCAGWGRNGCIFIK